MAVPVDIFVKDESPAPVVMPGVEVGIYDVGTHNFVAGATTDVNGKASFSLVGSVTPGTSYEARFYKLGVNFHGLRLIQILDPPTSGNPNKFDHTGADTNLLPVSGSPYTCRCTGVFVNLSGQPLANRTVRFVAQANDIDKKPKVWNTPSRMVAPDTLEVKTDVNGRVSVDLGRTGLFWVTFAGDDDTVWSVTVPDESAANLIDLIHPFPLLWDWDDTIAPGDAVSVAVGALVEVPINVFFSDFTERGTFLETFFDVMNSDGSKVESTYVSDRGVLVLQGVAPGATTQTPTLKTGLVPNRWPVPTVTAPA